jgi:hypothetical protein
MPRRPSNQFGTPKANDGTAYLERVVDIASSKGAEALKNVGQEYPRPLGSRRMSEEHQVAEMQLMKDYPDMIAEVAAQNEWSLDTFVSYLERMARKI